jgi:phage-related protein
VRIIDTDDYPDYYMIGRLSVTDVSNSNAYGILKIEAVCQPWRYAINQKSKAVTVAASDGNVSVTMTNNGYKTVAPTLTVTGTITLKYGTTTTTLSAGTYILAGLRFTPGVNTVTVAGTGSITISYQEAIF